MSPRWVGLLAVLFVACGSDSGGSGTGKGAGNDASSGSLPSCDVVCVDVVAANCTNGPVDQADCVSGCETIRAGSCAPRYQTLSDCGGANPKYACDANGGVTVTGCEAEYTALTTCLAGG